MCMKSSKMSRTRVICVKMRTRCPFSYRRFKSLSTMLSLPQFSTRCSPSGSRDRSSTPSNLQPGDCRGEGQHTVVELAITKSYNTYRYGWPQHFRSCMTIFKTTVRFLLVVFPVTLSRSRNNSFLYSCFCIFDIPTMRIVSVLGGNPLERQRYW
jgi:hypothetical protein